MAYPANTRIPVSDRYWVNGCDSVRYPTDIPAGGYHWLENGVNRGGVIQTRPGKRLVFLLPGSRAQGLAIYRPYRQKEQLVWAIDGSVFWSPYPFTSYFKLPNVSFYENSPKVYFCQARQGVKLNLDGSLTLLPTPVDVLMMQDGYTASAFYIATATSKPLQSGHNRGGAPFFQCPVGTVMVYSGSRLWVAYRETIYASDFLNPNSFAERTYLAESDGFKLPEPCTGLLEVSSDPTIPPQLLAFSPFTVTAIQSGVLDRTQWQTTPNFQFLASRDYGSIADFSPINLFGMAWFFSEVGFMSFNEAMNQYRSSRVNPQDSEMMRSRANISPDRKGICAVSFQNFCLVSVPSGSRFNRHTWVMDGTPMSELDTQAGPCWAGIWTGTFPVQYAAGEIQDVPRCFEIGYLCSQHNGNQIAIWEDFIGNRTDATDDHTENPISCSFETRIFEFTQTGELFRFKYAEIDIVELVGDVALQIYYAGIKGHYRLAYSLILSAEEATAGSSAYPAWTYQGLVTDTQLDSLRPQTRTVKTPEFSGSGLGEESDTCSDTCGIESKYQHDVDKGFQLLLNWQGQMGIREIRLFVEPYAQPGIGQCTPTEAGETNIVTAIGCLPVPKVCVIRTTALGQYQSPDDGGYYGP
jgi:hypothetical protein